MASLVPVADVTVGPVGSAEINNQPLLEDPLAGGEAVPWDPVAVHLSALYTCIVHTGLYTLYNAAARARCGWGQSAAGEF